MGIKDNDVTGRGTVHSVNASQARLCDVKVRQASVWGMIMD